MSGSLARVRLLVHYGAMALTVDLPVEVLEDLHAAAAASRDVHLDICGLYNTESLDEPGCTCGMPRLLRSLAELLPLPAGAREPWRPAWVPSARAA